MEETFTQPYRADIEAHPRVDAGSAAQHQLRRATSTINNKNWLIDYLDPRHRSSKRQARLFHTVYDFRVHPQSLTNPREEGIAVGDVTSSRGGNKTHPVAVVVRDSLGEGATG